MNRLVPPLLIAILLSAITALAQQKTVTIATVNNPDMIELKKLSTEIRGENPDIKLNWVIVEENIAASTSHDRRVDRQRPVRHCFYRSV